MDNYDQRFSSHLMEFMAQMGEDPSRPEIAATPARVLESMRYLTRGLREDLDALLADGIFEESSTDLVIVKNIEFVSFCEHHLLPFFGTAHVGYIPSGRIFGLSKLGRIVDHFASRFQVQERMTRQIAEAMIDRIAPSSLGIVVSAQHLCMTARGIRKQESRAVTTAWRGRFSDDPAFRNDFLSAIEKY